MGQRSDSRAAIDAARHGLTEQPCRTKLDEHEKDNDEESRRGKQPAHASSPVAADLAGVMANLRPPRPG